jgi:hypothetical protein
LIIADVGSDEKLKGRLGMGGFDESVTDNGDTPPGK